MDGGIESSIEIWRGGVNTWECDEMGHMNVRFYLSRFMEGLGGLALRLGLPDAFRASATATLLPRDHHLRFLKEAHAGAPLHMTGGVVAFGEDEATFLQVLIHTRSGEPCATAITRVAHASAGGRAFPWPARTRAAAEAMRVELPAFAAPRSVSADSVKPIASMAAAAGWGWAAPVAAWSARPNATPRDGCGRSCSSAGCPTAYRVCSRPYARP